MRTHIRQAETLVDRLSSNIGNLECSIATSKRDCSVARSRINASELPREQRSQLKQCPRLSVSRTPSKLGCFRETEPARNGETPNNERTLNVLPRTRKWNKNGTADSEACRDRKLNYGNDPSQATAGGAQCGSLIALGRPTPFNRHQSRPCQSRKLHAKPKLPGLTPSLYLLFAGTVLLLSHIVPGVYLKSIEDPASLGAKIDPNFQATLQPPAHRKDLLTSFVEEDSIRTTRSEATTPTLATTDQNDASSQDDDNDAEGCQGLSVGDSAEAKNYTDNERLVNLQTCIQRKIERRLNGAKRFGLEMFEKLAISGGCTSSIMNLVGSLNGIKSFAFKFLDATAKIPSGVMYGLLSDFGDFDQCLSIRSNPRVAPEDEAEENAFSGKYCLVSVKLNYHAHLEGNSTVPEGIIPDGVIWDELVRNYWTTKSPKGFQAGVCVPSRCTRDDLDQIYKYVADSYNVVGQIINCQDSLDLKNQYKPDFLQNFIIYTFEILIGVAIAGSILDRYCSNPDPQDQASQCLVSKASCAKLLLCFSIQRNWKTFIRTSNPNSNNWDSMTGTDSAASSTRDSSDFNESTSFGSQDMDERTANLSDPVEGDKNNGHCLNGQACDQLTVQVQPIDSDIGVSQNVHKGELYRYSLKHLSGLRLLVIIWITMGHSFLYPSANNYQYYRSIIKMNITRDSVWFATTNFTLGIDMLLYMTGLLFVYKLVHLSSTLRLLYPNSPVKRPSWTYRTEGILDTRLVFKMSVMIKLLLKKILKFWPTYLTLIGIAIIVPLLSDGPMWPEMVSKRLGDSCRRNWWSNLIFVNNLFSESNICLPSSWFISILMQLFVVGSLLITIIQGFSLRVTLGILVSFLMQSIGFSFGAAYFYNVRAPIIKMDESFVMELNEQIFWLYTTLANNSGPFFIGMLGGFLLIHAELLQPLEQSSKQSRPASPSKYSNRIFYANLIRRSYKEVVGALLVAAIATSVLSSVFIEEYSRFWAAIYWSLHRVGWAIVTGYIIHNCATGKCKLLNDVLSINALIPLNRLIPIAYLVYPIFIHMHSGLVRDGLHVSIYNMLNIYTTRLVLTFTTALWIHLLVELPFCSIVDLFVSKWTRNNDDKADQDVEEKSAKLHPLLAIAPVVSAIDCNGNDKALGDITIVGQDLDAQADKKIVSNESI